MRIYFIFIESNSDRRKGLLSGERKEDKKLKGEFNEDDGDQLGDPLLENLGGVMLGPCILLNKSFSFF